MASCKLNKNSTTKVTKNKTIILKPSAAHDDYVSTNCLTTVLRWNGFLDFWSAYIWIGPHYPTVQLEGFEVGVRKFSQCELVVRILFFRNASWENFFFCWLIKGGRCRAGSMDREPFEVNEQTHMQSTDR